ncbi:pseudouridine synthase [Glaciecola sp. 1036]|uniref:pseudouridine synthase n=1 Tax=Alteromonadaceae TaxID=72275 RepID=UPI003CFE6D39
MINIEFEDECLVVVNKPANMLVHRSAIDRRETVFLMQTLRDQLNCHVYPLHRLDKPTSGLVLFAKSSEIASQLQPQFEQQLIEKHYIAVVRGFVHEAKEIDYPLVEKLDKMTDNLDKQNLAKAAITNLLPLATLEIDKPVSRYPKARFSLVNLKPITGRKHQLRRHMAHIRHPIIGDTTHGDGKQNRFAREELNFHRLALHAYSMMFTHPVTLQKIAVMAKIDGELKALVKTFSELGINLTNNQDNSLLYSTLIN